MELAVSQAQISPLLVLLQSLRPIQYPLLVDPTRGQEYWPGV